MSGRSYARLLLFAMVTAAGVLAPGAASPVYAAGPGTFLITPTALDFGDVAIGSTSPQQTVTVTNVSSAPVVMNGAGGGAGQFGGVQDCQGNTVNPGTSCHMFYAFTPSALGPATGNTSGLWNGQSFSFTFSGNGIRQFLISPTSFDFGDVTVGTTSPQQTVTVTNVSNAAVVMSGAGGGAGQFGGVQDCQGNTLNPGQSCHMFYAFTPGGGGPVTGSTSGNWNGQPFNFNFKGNGVVRATFLISPTSFDFGDVTVGTTSPQQTVTVTNVSGSAVVMSGAGGGAGQFGGVQDCQGNTLNPAQSCHMFYAFTPSGGGPVTGNTSGLWNGQSFSFNFKGNGIALSTFLISPTALDFGDVTVGTTAPQQTITVTNVSGSAVVMSGAGGGAGQFGGVQDCQGNTLNPAQSCHMFYAFTPSGGGPAPGSTSGNWNGQSFSFSFSGNGVDSASVHSTFLITPTSFDFGDVTVGKTSPQQTVTVTNVSSSAVVMSGAGGGAGQFGGVQDCQGNTLSPGQSCHMFYAFTPSAGGPATGNTSGNWNGQSFNLNFKGNGVVRATFLISPTSFDFGDVTVGTTSPQQTLTVTNVSGSPVVMSGAGGGAGQFGGVQDCQGNTLAAGASCHMFYAFTPSAGGPATGNTSGNWNGQSFSFNFAGNGISLSTFLISPTSFDFGDVPLGTTAPQQTLTVTNVSGSPVLMSGAGGGAGQFGGVQDCQGITLNPGASCHMFYAFTPSALGQATGNTSGNWNGQSFTFTFSGNGIRQFLITPTSFDFGNVPTGTTSATQTVSVTNVSGSAVVMSGAGGGAGQFGGVQDCQGNTLNAGATCHMFYAFTPSLPGPASGTTSGTWNGQPFSFSFAGNGVGKANQTITFGPLANKTFGDPPFTVSATASSGLAVSFAASGACTVAGSTVTVTGAGGCTIIGSQAGDSNYNPAPDVSQSFNTSKTNQIISFGPLPYKTFGDPPFNVSATASSGLAVSFTASGACTVSGSLVTLTSGGTCSITASQAGNANYNAATPVTQTFSVALAEHVVGFETGTPTSCSGGSLSSFTGVAFGSVSGVWSAAICHTPLSPSSTILGGAFTLHANNQTVSGSFTGGSIVFVNEVDTFGFCTQTYIVNGTLTDGTFNAVLTHYGFITPTGCRVFFAAINGTARLTP